MSAKSSVPKTDSELPQDALSVIEWLSKVIPTALPGVKDIGTEEARIHWAFELGRRDVVDMLRKRYGLDPRGV